MQRRENVVVTGGAGFIGSHVCKALYEEGYQPVVIDNLSTGHRGFVQWGPLHQMDIRETDTLSRLLLELRPLCVFHMAASINVRESMTDPSKYYHNNVIATLSLLDAMVASNIKSIVFSSTASIFGNPIKVPIEADHPKAPLHAYGKSKYMVEMILEDYEKAHGITSAALRYFNAAGSDVEGKIGEAHTPETHLIPLIIQTALGKKEQLDIYGTSYPTPDGTAIRDYIHVTDLASAHISAMRYLLEKKQSIQVNLGTGAGYSVAEVIAAVEKISQKPVKRCVAAPSKDAHTLVAEPSKAFDELCWTPRHSSLEEIVVSAYRWFEKQ